MTITINSLPSETTTVELRTLRIGFCTLLVND